MPDAEGAGKTDEAPCRATGGRPRRWRNRARIEAGIARTHRHAFAVVAREAYGYEIGARLTAATDGALEVTDGTLYPILYRLERSNYVSVRWETPERGIPRKYYRLTDSGHDELKRLIQEWTAFTDAMTKLLGHAPEAT